jgi:hypothetical protein
MKTIGTILTIIIILTTFTSCKRWQVPSTENKYLTVLKRDNNLTKTKVRLASEIRVDAATQDTMTSTVSDGKATITTTTLIGVTIPAKTKGKIIEEEGIYYFVFNEKEYRKKVGKLPINVEKSTIYIRTIKQNIIGTRLVVDNNAPGFELRIKEKERTESIKATN